MRRPPGRRARRIAQRAADTETGGTAEALSPRSAAGLLSGPVSSPATVSDLLQEVADLHHRVYRITDGEDADWPAWYAAWLVDLSELPDLLGRRPTRSELIHLLVDLDAEIAAGAAPEPWEQYYARRITEHFGAAG